MVGGNKQKPWVIFDLDHTLFDTTAFKKEIFTTLKACGVDDATAEFSFDSFTAAHEGNYDMLAHCEELIQKKKLASLEKVHSFLTSSHEQYLVRDTKKVLAELRTRGYRLVLLTKGIERFQKIKIEQTGLAPFFDEICIVYTSGHKEKEVKNMNPPKGSYFVNDHVPETERVHRAHPKLHCILFMEECDNASAISSSLPKIISLQELLKLLA